jgi:hypothetical protein
MKLDKRKIEEWITDAALIGGFLMLFYGLYLWWAPAAFIVCGLGLILLFGIPFKGAK